MPCFFFFFFEVGNQTFIFSVRAVIIYIASTLVKHCGIFLFCFGFVFVSWLSIPLSKKKTGVPR